MKRFERLLGQRLLWRDGPIHGRYRISLASNGANRIMGDNVHTDPFSWNAVLCLSRDQDCRGGVSFFRHRETGLLGEELRGTLTGGRTAESVEDEAHRVMAEHGADLAHWEELSRVDLRYN